MTGYCRIVPPPARVLTSSDQVTGQAQSEGRCRLRRPGSGRRADEPVDHAIGRSRGGLSTRTHALVDGRGRPRTTPDAVRGDKAYSARARRAYLRSRGITAVISERSDQIRHRLNRGSAGGRPVDFDTEDYKNRTSSNAPSTDSRTGEVSPLATTDTPLMYRGGMVLTSIMLWLAWLTRHALVLMAGALWCSCVSGRAVPTSSWYRSPS